MNALRSLCRVVLMQSLLLARRSLATNAVEKEFRRRRFNPRDQFGTLGKGSVPQAERLQPGFENIWTQGEELLKRENAQELRRHESVQGKFERCKQITEPFRADARRRERRHALRQAEDRKRYKPTPAVAKPIVAAVGSEAENK